MPVAAIEALVEALSQISTSTVSETLKLLSEYTEKLKSAVANPISLSAGTDLFQRYLTSTLHQQQQQQQQHASPTSSFSSSGSSLDSDFRHVRAHLITNGRLFVARAKEARFRIGSLARRFIRDGCTILTAGHSRVVASVLRSAAEAGADETSVRFRVIYVLGHGDSEGAEAVATLQRLSVPVAVVPDCAVGYSLSTADMVFVGAEGVVENGGIISQLGTYQIAVLARAAGKPFYVVAESHKFVRLYPLGQSDLPIDQRLLEFRTENNTSEKDSKVPPSDDLGASSTRKHVIDNLRDAVDFTVRLSSQYRQSVYHFQANHLSSRQT